MALISLSFAKHQKNIKNGLPFSTAFKKQSSLVIKRSVSMIIGFRYDEKERVEDFQKEQKWRSVKFPLVENKIGHYTVYKWVQSTGLVFPPDSNCVGCFWKPVMQLRKNFETNPEKMEWFASKEIRGRKWKSDVTFGFGAFCGG